MVQLLLCHNYLLVIGRYVRVKNCSHMPNELCDI